MNTISIPAAAADTSPKPRLANFTRESSSIPRRLLREGRWHWLPVYWLMRLSDLAREGIERSGSHQFADHIYCNEASGRGPVGRWLDQRLLNLPATQAFRRRYLHARNAIAESFATHNTETFRILSIPCGLPREYREFVSALEVDQKQRVVFTGMDIDPVLLERAAQFSEGTETGRQSFHLGDALDADTWPAEKFHHVTCTGLGEFLDDTELAQVYANVHAALESGGTFYTSATARDDRSEALLDVFELRTRYRSPGDLRILLAPHSWKSIDLVVDKTGMQTFVRAVKR